MSANEGTVTCEVSDHIATLTLSNPTKRNSLTVEMWEAIPRLLNDLATNDEVRVVILRGRGDVFSAGSDITNLTYLHNSDLPGLAENALATFPKPVVAVIAGHCMGGGCQLATACDFRVAGEGADFAVPPAKLGIVYPLSATRRLVSLIGPSATKYLIFTGDRISATRALHMGLIDELVSPDLLLERGRNIAATIARRSQLTLQATKEIVDAIADDHPADELVDGWVDQAHHGPDLAEGMSSFSQRRQAQFTWTRA
ncbi:MAG TPA: enoyl-CoA hydratase/isomerase family protein [Propionibacteriaceae bacterium]|nr:enoyl-CoA hydratase/isomerase family protein [Propionibacteriaceae bacterium]